MFTLKSLHSPKSVVGRLAIIMMMVSVFSVGCGLASEAENSSDDSVSPQARFAQPSENHYFHSFPEMVATADATIIGSVTAQLEGGTAGDEFDSIDFFRFETDVEHVLAGDLDLESIILQIDEVSFNYILGDTTWTQPGERFVMFLGKRRDEGPLYYRPVNSQGIYRIVDADRLEKTRDDDLTRRVAAWSLTELRHQIEAAKAQIDRGEIQPQPGPLPRRQP